MTNPARGADIQIENGEYIRLHNKIAETLSRATLAALEFQIVWFVIRQTYGYNKTMDTIAISQFASTTGASRQAVISALHNLVRLGVLRREQVGTQRYAYGFNKYFETWLPEAFQSRYAGRAKNFTRQQTSKAVETGKVVETGKAVETKTGKVVETGTGKAVETHKRQKDNKDNSSVGRKSTRVNEPKEPGYQEMFSAVATVCVLDPRLKATLIGKTARELVTAGYCAEQVAAFSKWWQADPWRKAHTPVPNINQLKEKLPQSIPKTPQRTEEREDPQTAFLRREREKQEHGEQQGTTGH